MKINPVYKRETMVGSRSFRMSLIVLVFNSAPVVAALLSMYSVIARVKVTAEIRHSSFLELHTFVATMEFTMLMLIISAIMAGSISGEREGQTLKLMPTTKMTSAEIVPGKLLSSLSIVVILTIFSFLVLALVSIYGGVRIPDVGMPPLCYVTTTFLAGCLGICFLSIFKRSTLATVISYCVIILLVVGTYAANRFVLSLSQATVDTYLVNAESMAQQVNSGGLLYPMLLSLAVTFYVAINGQVGNDQVVSNITRWFGEKPANVVAGNWNLFSIEVQLALAALLLWIAIRKVNPRKKKQRMFVRSGYGIPVCGSRT